MYNHDRLPLYYQQHDVRAIRYQFMKTLLDGNYELYALVLEQIRDMWDIFHEALMSKALTDQIQQDVAWFYRHKETISDPDKQHAFVVQCQGKQLQLLKRIGEELDRLQRGAEYERPTPVAVDDEDG